MKWCNRCRRDLPHSAFTKASSRYDGFQAYCADCMKQYRTEHYHKKPLQYQKRARARDAELRTLVWEIKTTTPCSDCGEIFENEPWLVEFDHVPGMSKDAEITQLLRLGVSKKRLLAEIAKCDVVCVLCHRKRTATRGGWSKDTYLKRTKT